MASSRRLTLRLVCVAALLGGCIVPTDKSDQLSIQFAAVPASLLKGDSVALAATLVDGDGVAVPNAEIEITSAQDLVVRVLGGDLLLAVDTGSATITARAIQYAETPPATQSVTVRGLLEVDSIRPARPLRYGERLSIYGIGLSPTTLFGVAIGGEAGGEVLDVAGYVPASEDRPNRLGELQLWVAPPASTSNGIAIVTAQGGLVLNDQVSIVPRDIYEPNDTVPSDLGTISNGFDNQALAYEPRLRADPRVPVDWYTFTLASSSDVTIGVDGRGLGGPLGLYVTDSLGWDNFLWDPPNFGIAIYPVASDGWMVGAGANICRGLLLDLGLFGLGTFSPFQLRSQEGLIPIRGLPAGTYHVLVSYIGFPFTFYDDFAVPARAELDLDVADSLLLRQPTKSWVKIWQEYVSPRTPDQAEENDYCDVATPATIPSSATLNFDVPFDVDWFRFTLGTTQAVQFTVSAADTTGDADLWVVRDDGNALIVEDFGLEFGADDATVGYALPPGDYYLVVVDYVGVPTSYDLSSTILPAPPAGVSAARAAAATRAARKLESLDVPISQRRTRGR